MERIRRGETVGPIETVRERKDGKLIDVSLSVAPIRDTEMNIIGASKIARDITESKHLERQLRQSQKMEAVGNLTGGIAHDFNNLLAVVIGNLDILARLVEGDEAASKRVENAQKAAVRGADLTRRMLAFSRLQPLRPTATLLDEAVQNVVAMAGRLLGANIRISVDFDLTIAPVLVDATGLENALLNLAINARDAMPDGGSLVISTAISELEESFGAVQPEELQPGRYARVTVSDTGHGMSRETLDRVFEPFFSTKPHGQGTGLGLAMVYGFAKQSGGAVRIDSELGHGTAVTLFLPLANGAATAEVAVPDGILRSGSGRSVLVVDDDADLLELAVEYLEHVGYRVFHAPDGATALKVLERETAIDLLVTDVLMPGGMNGVDLARRARQLNSGLRIVYTSGFPADALAEQSATRVDGPLLNKPYRRNDFVNAVHKAMEAPPGTLDDDPSMSVATIAET